MSRLVAEKLPSTNLAVSIPLGAGTSAIRSKTDDATIAMKPPPESSSQEVLAGLVERVTYHNAENGCSQPRNWEDVLKLAETCRSKRRLYGVLQRIQIDWLDKATRQPGGDPVDGQDLNSV